MGVQEKMDVGKMVILIDTVMMNAMEELALPQLIHHRLKDVMKMIHHRRSEALTQNVVAQNLADMVEEAGLQFHVHAQTHIEISNY